MATPEIIQSWAITETYLKKAKALLDSDVVSKNSGSLSLFDEFLNHNELGLAFEWLESIAMEDQWDSIKLLEVLKLAADNMSLFDKVNVLNKRIIELSGQ